MKNGVLLSRWTIRLVLALVLLVVGPSWAATGYEPVLAPSVGSTMIGAAALAAGGSIPTQSSALDAEAPITKNTARQSGQRKNFALGDRTLFGRHNLIPGRVGTAEICVFCHTPQGDEAEVRTPLWNRAQSSSGEYKAYSSIGSATRAATGSISVACLSCHDGTQAPNVVINSPISNTDIYPDDNQPKLVGYLNDHHPVSMLFAGGGISNERPTAPVDTIAAFKNMDYGEMAFREVIRPKSVSRKYRPADNKMNPSREVRYMGQYIKPDFNIASHSGSGSGTVWWLESGGTGAGRQKSDFYLYTRTDTVDGLIVNRPYVECSSCHDPHSTNTTFLRINNVGSAVCLTCHAK